MPDGHESIEVTPDRLMKIVGAIFGVLISAISVLGLIILNDLRSGQVELKNEIRQLRSEIQAKMETLEKARADQAHELSTLERRASEMSERLNRPPSRPR